MHTSSIKPEINLDVLECYNFLIILSYMIIQGLYCLCIFKIYSVCCLIPCCQNHLILLNIAFISGLLPIPTFIFHVMIVCKGSPRFTTINLRSEDTVIKLYCRPYWLCEINIVMSFYFLFIITTSSSRVTSPSDFIYLDQGHSGPVSFKKLFY